MVALVLDGLVGFPAGLSPTSFHLSPTSFHLSPTSFHLSPRLGACGRVPGRLVGFPAGLSPTSLHLSPTFSPNSLLLGVLNSFLRCVRPLCHCWCPPFSAGHAAFLFICLPGLSLLVSALFRRPCSISIHLFPRFVTAGVRPFPHPSGTKNQFHITSFAPHAFISCPHVVSSPLIEQHDQHHVRT